MVISTLPPLTFGSGSITFYKDVNIGSQFSVLNRIAVGKHEKGVSVMAIGHTDVGSDPDLYGANRVLYINNYSIGTACIYEPTGSYTNVRFWDVVATHNYFAVPSSNGIPANAFFMHKIPIGTSPAYFMTDFGNPYRYSCNIDMESGIRAAAMGNDSVAFATYYTHDYADYGLQEFTLSVPTGAMDYYQSYIQPVNNPQPIPMLPPSDMVYMGGLGHLMVIDDLLDNSNSVILQLNPYPALVPFYGAPYFISKPGEKATSLAVTGTYCTGILQVPYYGKWTNLDMSMIVPPYYYYDPSQCIETYMADILVHDPCGPEKDSFGRIVSYTVVLEDESPILTKEEELRPGCPVPDPPKK